MNTERNILQQKINAWVRQKLGPDYEGILPYHPADFTLETHYDPPHVYAECYIEPTLVIRVTWQEDEWQSAGHVDLFDLSYENMNINDLMFEIVNS